MLGMAELACPAPLPDPAPSSAGYGSAGEQAERRASPKGLVPAERVLEQCQHALRISQPIPLAACEKLRRFGGRASKNTVGKAGARQVNQGMLRREKKQLIHRLPSEFVRSVLSDVNAGSLDSKSLSERLSAFAEPSQLSTRGG